MLANKKDSSSISRKTDVENLVSSWIVQSTINHIPSNKEDFEFNVRRPSRLGIGAKFTPNYDRDSNSAASTSSSLEKRLFRKKKEHTNAEDNHNVEIPEEDKEEEEDSRTNSFQKKSFISVLKNRELEESLDVVKRERKKKRKSSLEITAQAESYVTDVLEHNPVGSLDLTTNQILPLISSSDRSVEDKSMEANLIDEGFSRSEAKKRRRKTRSKQKNIKKDKRPPELRPAFAQEAKLSSNAPSKINVLQHEKSTQELRQPIQSEANMNKSPDSRQNHRQRKQLATNHGFLF